MWCCIGEAERTGFLQPEEKAKEKCLAVYSSYWESGEKAEGDSSQGSTVIG